MSPKDENLLPLQPKSGRNFGGLRVFYRLMQPEWFTPLFLMLL